MPGPSTIPGASERPGAFGPAGGQGGDAAESRGETRGGWGRLGSQATPGAREESGSADKDGVSGPVIRQRESALPEDRPTPAVQVAISIAPDGLESFARDLRALRAKAELDYPEMAEVSHYTMKTLASAAGGLRLPTLPVAVAYVRACGGDEAEWEDRWHKLAERIVGDMPKKALADGEASASLPEPADRLALPELSVPAAPPDTAGEPGEVYVITSAKPRQADRPGQYGRPSRW